MHETLSIPEYDLSCPTEKTALTSLERVVGPERAAALWERACSEAGLQDARRPLSLEQLAAAAEQLARVDGFPGVLGVALRVRIDTYNCLARRSRIA